ncbi:D-alanyl-D-alanine carboxypeptidase (penicillin-binding protein 5/6) [Klenkia soli]|uniref:D-alanyl-D-alanine carboxypeptidase (Penicillin-binding protein 5/6) n=1 Tax=Klenkia soli TaxID=1052260 RepID=A0A1H0N601_9ACTN|nr:D-alanyl-D-alanine carboxypeptidase [Klenkia soli]SDO88103.1 D-alanyl-D-alanine carboxypeptidase (penicillin-binding protein 5/6) [Klenkia soli]
MVSTYRHGQKLSGPGPVRPPSPRPAARRVVRRRRWPRAVGVLAVLLGGVLLVEHVVAPAEAGAPAVVAGPDIAWPAQGQAAYTTSAITDLRAGGPQEPVPIASLTKVMTAWVVLQQHPLEVGEDGPTMQITQDDVADTQRRRDGGESVVDVEAGEELTELQALEALLLPSANNVAVVLARFTAGSEADFVDLMNAAADDLGLAGTHYDDASGMSAASVSTAADQVVLYDVALRDPVFAAISGAATAEIPVAGTVSTTNGLLGTDGFVAGKTGSHDAAGGCLVFRVDAVVDGRPVTVTGAVLGQRGGPQVQAGLDAAQALATAVRASSDVQGAA